ncbi:MAG: hypothetical protein KBD50_02500 [Candidatus Pacebacteria bacterium]|nr:hypothetical protein [Candidatus Paceibacterota bacterium]
MTDTLIKLFGSAPRVKLLRLFLFNPRHSFTVSLAATRARVKEADARNEINMLLKIGILERSARSKASVRYGINPNSPYILALQNLLLNTPARASEMYQRLRGAGTLKLVVVSGVFANEWDGRLDLLIVGERINEGKLVKSIKLLESEIGKEVRYASMSTDDFFYRLNMNDRLVRDVFDYPHKVVHDRLDIGLK